MIRKPNATSEINYTKYTYNFPNNLKLACQARFKELGYKHLSDYLTALIRRDLSFRRPDELVKVVEFCLHHPSERDNVTLSVVGRRESIFMQFLRRAKNMFKPDVKKQRKDIDETPIDQYDFYRQVKNSSLG